MKRIQRYKKTIAMSAAALSLLAGLSLESSMAYFTTYVSAGGSHVVNLDARTEIHESVSNLTKHLTLENISTKGDCFVRVKVFHGAQVKVDIYDAEGGNNWYKGDQTDAYGYEYWYYRPVLPIGGTTTGLDIKIDVTDLLKDPNFMKPEDPNAEWIKDKFNVVVVQECTPVIYGENGEATADWNTIYTDFVEVEGGEEAGN